MSDLEHHLDPRWLLRRLRTGQSILVTVDGQEIPLRPPEFASVDETNLKSMGFKKRRKGILAKSDACWWWVEIKDRKSRYVMRDGKAMYEAVCFLDELAGDARVIGWTISRAPICSKTRAWLDERGFMLTELASVKKKPSPPAESKKKAAVDAVGGGVVLPPKGSADEWPIEEAIQGSRVMLHVRRLVQDRRILEEIGRQIRSLSHDEFRVLNSLPHREFEEVVNGAIFDAGEKIKFWERFQEGLATGKSRLGTIAAKARVRIAAILKREMSASDYRDMNRLTDSGFRDALKVLFGAMAEAGAMSMAPGAVGDAIREALGGSPSAGSV